MSEVVNVAELFGKNVFNETVMRERLPKSVFKKLKKTIEDGAVLDPSIADVVAHAMKDWAIERGATHYTHWFQPLTGITAEKHDSFISALCRLGLHFPCILKRRCHRRYSLHTHRFLFLYRRSS